MKNKEKLIRIISQMTFDNDKLKRVTSEELREIVDIIYSLMEKNEITR